MISAVRAYTNGESEYSKGQKDASLFLIAYVESGDQKYWISFRQAISIPQNDKLARLYMLADSSRAATEEVLLLGRNDSADIPNMILLFKTFRSWAFMKKIIKIWEEGDVLIDELNRTGVQAHSRIANTSMPEAEAKQLIKIVNDLSAKLSEKEHAFSAALGSISRKVNIYLVWVNVFCIIVIVGNIAVYAIRTVRKLNNAANAMELKNVELANANKELDTFVYSLSHDLRSPIASIKGVTSIACQEDDIEIMRAYMVTIGDVIDKQDAFIKEIIDFFRNKRASIKLTPVSLSAVVNEIIQVNRYIPGAGAIKIDTSIETDSIICDELRIKMILNNLVSNAIKYSDDRKTDKQIKISTAMLAGNVLIRVEDNGVGIDKEYFEKIFQMFFVTPNNNRGTGLGLYILKQNVEKLGGSVSVASQLNIGSIFAVSLPVI